jgi:hypothetical protein
MGRQPLAQAIKPLGDLLAGVKRQLLGADVENKHLDAALMMA